MEYVEVVVPLPISKSFKYILPQGIAYNSKLLGSRIIVPFGARKIQGFICGKSDGRNKNNSGGSEKRAGSKKPNHAYTGTDSFTIKHAYNLLDSESLFSPTMYKLLCWAAEYYNEPLGQVLDTAIPQYLRKGKPVSHIFITKWKLSEKGRQVDINKFNSKFQRKLFELMLKEEMEGKKDEQEERNNSNQAKSQEGYEFSSAALKALKIPSATLTALEKKGLLIKQDILNMPKPKFHGIPYVKPELNDEQSNAVEQVVKSFGKFGCFLLEGLTNSGKTEVYIEIIRHILKQNKQAIYLVPEIGLSPQSLERLGKSLAIPLGLTHSSMRPVERLHNWLLMKEDHLKVLVGTRSAAFVPLAKPGCIIIDEEHDSSYKQSSGFRYNSKHFLIKRAAELNIPIVLGSATPSLESFHNAMSGKYKHLRLTKKIKPGAARADIIPLKGRFDPNSIAAEGLTAIRETLARGGQVLVFINRRGFAPRLRCNDCNWHASCPSCDRPMTLHRVPPHLSCHLCERNSVVPHKCPSCDGGDLIPSGLATQSIEYLLQAEFPNEKIFRIDRDTMRNKDALRHFYLQSQAREPCILVGTQILAKGHDFTNVRLGLILNCDAAIFSNDFHNVEQIAQLITQVMGRVGRHKQVARNTASKTGDKNLGKSGGEASIKSESDEEIQDRIIIPTYNPDNPLLIKLVRQGYAAFAREEMNNRKKFNLPPYSFIAYMRSEAPEASIAADFLANIKRELLGKNNAGYKIFGPIEASIMKRNNLYRFVLIIKGHNRTAIHRCLKQLRILAEGRHKPGKLIHWHLDLDPLDPP